MKYEGENHIRVGILIFQSLHSEQPILNILGALDCSGVKRKWKKPMKIKRWLLYDHHSCSYATRFLRKTIFNDDFKITEVGEKMKLGLFDRDIIRKKFPSMSNDLLGINLGKKKRK